MKRRRYTKAETVAIFKSGKGVCHLCDMKIKGDWVKSHVKTRAMFFAEGVAPIDAAKMADDLSNIRPAHPACNARRSAKEEVPAVAKAKRVEEKRKGLKAEPKKRLPGNRLDDVKLKVGGGVAERKSKESHLAHLPRRPMFVSGR